MSVGAPPLLEAECPPEGCEEGSDFENRDGSWYQCSWLICYDGNCGGSAQGECHPLEG